MFCQEAEGREGCPRMLLPLFTRGVRLGRLPNLSVLPTPQLKNGADDEHPPVGCILLRRCNRLIPVKHMEQGVAQSKGVTKVGFYCELKEKTKGHRMLGA